jgi:hypothetical protein
VFLDGQAASRAVQAGICLRPFAQSARAREMGGIWMASVGLDAVAQDSVTPGMRFAPVKFRPQALPVTLVTRSAL